MILIRNGRVIGPAEGLDIKADVVLDGGRIAKIIPAAGQGKDGRIGDTGDGGENGPDGARADDMGADSADMHGADTYGADTDSAVAGSGPYAQIIDAEGMIVAPGLVDVHVHFRDPGLTYKEDIRTGAKAAAKGGFTTVVCMANTKPIVDNKETLSYVLEEGKKTGIHVLSCAAVSMGFKGQELTDMEGLLAAGAAGFTDDGLCAPPWKKPRGWIPCSAFMRRTRHLLRKMESTMERYRTSWESMVPRRWQRTPWLPGTV